MRTLGWLVMVMLARGTALAEPAPEQKSENAALGLSLGVTLGGAGVLAGAYAYDESELTTPAGTAVLVTSGMLLVAVGPTLGHAYAGHTWNPGLKVRLISAGTFFASVIPFLSLAFSEAESSTAFDVSLAALGTVAGASLLTYAGATIYEIGTASASARRYNARHATSIAIAPYLGSTPGLAVVGRF